MTENDPVSEVEIGMTTKKTRLKDIVYGELLLQCGDKACIQIFAPTLDEPACDPVERWSYQMAERALEAGWSVGMDGNARCPMHPDVENRT